MSLHPQEPPSVPEETNRVARAAFPKGSLCLQIADELGSIYTDDQFSALFPRRGKHAEAPGRLALATVLQFVEGLSDRQAADAVRGRIDWKYALGLSLIDPGFDHTVLSEFRSRLIKGGAERQLLDTLLQRLRDRGLVKAKGRQRTDSTHVLAAVRGLNRLERVGETARAALNELAIVAPDWLQALAPPAWYERYSRRVENYRLPKAEKERLELAATIGTDGDQLLAAIDAAVEQPWLAQLPAIHVLREVWTAQYIKEDGQLRWRTVQERPATAEQISSPYDPEARYGKKRDISWTGYKAHLTETCDPETPRLWRRHRTTICCQLCINHWQRVSCCHRNIWSTWVTPAAACWSTASSAMVLSLSARSLKTQVGRRTPQKGSARQTFMSTGIRSRDLPGGQTEYLMAAQHLSKRRHAIRGPLRAK